MAQRIWVDPRSIKRGRMVVIEDGAEMILEISPYDMPKSVFGMYNRLSKYLMIEFRYIDDEKPSKLGSTFSGITISSGLWSRKVMFLTAPVAQVPIDKHSVQDLRLQIEGAIKQSIKDISNSRGPHASEILNREVVIEILSPRTFFDLAADLLGPPRLRLQN